MDYQKTILKKKMKLNFFSLCELYMAMTEILWVTILHAKDYLYCYISLSLWYWGIISVAFLSNLFDFKDYAKKYCWWIWHVNIMDIISTLSEHNIDTWTKNIIHELFLLKNSYSSSHVLPPMEVNPKNN